MRCASLLRLPFLAALLAACHGAQPAGAPARGRPESGDFSVYELPGSWRDAAGAPRELGSLGGKVRVVALVYTHCANTCPQVIADFKQLEARLSTEARERTGFVLVSLDPERDTPAQLKSFATITRLDPARWTLLTGSEEGVMELAALLGIRYRREAGAEISHANTWLVLDRTGHIAYRHAGNDEGLDEPLDAIRSLVAAEEAAPRAGR